ncbi:MAG: extracellular solute-binding protein, partial [Pirellulales bacterium]
MSRLSRLIVAAAAAGIMLPMAAPAMAQDYVNFRMAIWSANKGHLDLFNGIAAAYKAMHPNVTVAFESLDFNTYNTTLTTQIAGGNAPDLAWIFETSAKDFVTSGALAPLKETFSAASVYDLPDVTQSALSLCTEGGDIYGYPF